MLKTDKPAADDAVPTLFSDSTVALANAAKPINWLSEKLKHVEIHINFFRQYVQAGYFQLAKIASALNPSDALTKSYASREAFRAAISHFMKELPFAFRPTTRSAGEARLGGAEPGSGGVRPMNAGGKVTTRGNLPKAGEAAAKALPDGRWSCRTIGRMAQDMWCCRMARGVAGGPTADQGLKSMARHVGMALPDGQKAGRHGMDLFGRRRPHGLMGRPAGPPRQLSARSHSLMHATRSHPVKSSGPARRGSAGIGAALLG